MSAEDFDVYLVHLYCHLKIDEGDSSVIEREMRKQRKGEILMTWLGNVIQVLSYNLHAQCQITKNKSACCCIIFNITSDDKNTEPFKRVRNPDRG